MEKLTKAEEDIMHLIWNLERCTVADLIDAMGIEPRPPHSTISSIVRILEKKGYVNHKSYGKTYEYFAAISKQEYGKKSLGKLLMDYFDGSANTLVSYLVQEKNLKINDLEELIQKLDKSTPHDDNNSLPN